MSGGRGWPASKGCCAPTEHSSLSSSGWEVWVPGTARNGDRGLTVDTIPELLPGSRGSVLLCKANSRSTHLPGYCHGAAFNHFRVISWRGKRPVSKFSCVCSEGPIPGCASAAITVFM